MLLCHYTLLHVPSRPGGWRGTVVQTLGSGSTPGCSLKFFWPEGSPGSSDVSDWNFRAVIWFHLSICSLVILPGPVAPIFCFCSAFGAVYFLLSRGKKIFFFFLETGFSVLPLFLVSLGVFCGKEMISWWVVSVPCYLMALVLAICAFRYV